MSSHSPAVTRSGTRALYDSVSALVQSLSSRFMLASPNEEAEVLNWMCQQLGETLRAEVVAIRDLDETKRATVLSARWSRLGWLTDEADERLQLRGDALPMTALIARRPDQMPVMPRADAARAWGESIGVENDGPLTVFCPLLDGSISTGFVCVVLKWGEEASGELVALLSSVAAVVSQFRMRIAAERLLRRQMELTILQGEIAQTFAAARADDAERVLTYALHSIGEHLAASSLSLWYLSSDGSELNRSMRWINGHDGLEIDGLGSVSLAVRSLGPGTSWMNVSPVKPAFLASFRQTGDGRRSPAASDMDLWSVPIVVEGKPQGCLVIGLSGDRQLAEWEAVGLRSIGSLLPVIKSRFAAEEHLTAALQTSPTGITLRNSMGELLDCNQAYCDFLGVTDKTDLLGSLPADVIAPAYQLEPLMFDGVAKDLPFTRVDGTIVWGRSRVTRISRLHGDRILGHVVDITADLAERETLRQRAHIDELTGLPNRHGFADIVAQSVVDLNHGPEQAQAALIMIDVNEFKGVNDTFGHATGDAVLREISRRLQTSIRSTDRAIRYGGDEFVILLDGPLSAKDAHRIADSLHAPLADPVMVGDLALDVSLSIGVTLVWGELSTSFADVLHRADVAMYRAKDRGPGSTELLAGSPTADLAVPAA